jgi:V/A-type H+-transporting ATPase subunit I
MLTPSKMHLFRVIIPEKISELVLFPLLEQTDLQFVEFESVQPDGVELKKYSVSSDYESIKMIEEKLLAIDHRLHFKDHIPEITNYDFIRRTDHSQDIRRLTEFTDRYFSLLNRLNSRKNRLEELEAATEKTKTFTKVDNVFDLDSSHILFYKFGTLDYDRLAVLRKDLQRVPVILYPLTDRKEKGLMLVLGMVKNKAYVESALRKEGWSDLDISKEFRDLADVYKDLDGAKESLRTEIASIEKEMDELVNKDRDYLYMKYWEFHYLRMMNDIKTYFKRSGDNACLSFWVPQAEKAKVIDVIKRVSRNRCYIEGIEASQVEAFKQGKIRIPILFENPLFFKPFQSFVSAYGVPAYGTIDPTPIFTITYMLMFGFMFSDFGHGLVIFLLGFLMFKNTGVQSWLKRALGITSTDFAKIFIYCGASSMFFGALFGSVFGYEHVIKALWLHPINNIMLMVGVTIGFGVFYLVLGIVFNLINSYILKDLKRGIFDNFGLLGALFYFAALGILAVGIGMGKDIPSWIVWLGLGLPIVLLFFKGPILYLMKQEHEPFEGGLGAYLAESLVGIMELFIGYLSNTVSFVRIGAFAISHAGLFIGVFTVENMIKGLPAFPAWDVILIILANLGIIILEGFLSGVQALRLQFYEFFTKFYREGELIFKPIKLK